MPRYDLAAMARRARNVRRSSIVLRDIVPPAVLATDLYRAVYAPIVAAWSAGAERIIAEYERTLDQLRPLLDQLTVDSPADVEREVDSVAAQIQRLLLILTPELRSWAIRTEGWVRGKFRGAILTATGIDLGTMLGPADARATVETVIARNVALVKDVSAQAQGRISDAVFRGVTERRPARDVAKDIRDAVGMARDRSIRIASHQLSSFTSDLARERRREAGLSVFAWHHSMKKHPRKNHQAREGNLYSEDPAMIGKKVDGKTILKAPPANDRAGVPPYCGCRERGVLIFDFD